MKNYTVSVFFPYSKYTPYRKYLNTIVGRPKNFDGSGCALSDSTYDMSWSFGSYELAKSVYETIKRSRRENYYSKNGTFTQLREIISVNLAYIADEFTIIEYVGKRQYTDSAYE